MPNDERIVEYTPEFKRNLRLLARRYRHIRSDLSPIIEALRRGETPGTQVPGTTYTVFKVRAKNTDARKGKSGGYRIIYFTSFQRHKGRFWSPFTPSRTNRTFRQ